MKYLGTFFLVLGLAALASSGGSAAPLTADSGLVAAQLPAPGDEVARLDQIVVTPTGTEVGQRQTSRILKPGRPCE